MEPPEFFDPEFLNHLPLGVYRSEPGGMIRYANHAFISMLGFEDLKDIKRRTASELYDDSEGRSNWQKVMAANGSVRNYKVRFKTKSGSSIWARETARAVFDENGAVRYYQGFVLDISTEKENEEKYQQWFDEMPQPGLETDSRGRILKANKAIKRMLGYESFEKLKARNEFVWDLTLPAEDRNAFRDEFLKGVYEGFSAGQNVSVPAERTFEDSKGGSVPVRFRSQCLLKQGDENHCVIFTLEDLSIRGELKGVWRTTDYEQLALLDRLAFKVLRKDLTHRFTHGNPAALKELNVSLADLRGKSDEDYFPPSLVRRYLEGDNKILVEGLKRVEWIERHGLIDSKLALVHMIKEPLYDAQGELAGVQVIYWDVENRKAVIDAYKKAFEQLEADYRAIVNYAVEGIYRSTLNGRYLEANDRLAHIYGYSDRKNLIDSITDIRQQLYLDPADRDRFMNEIGLPPYEVRDFAYRVWRVEKDGRRSPIWISENARAVRNEKNEILYYEGFISDITDKKWFEDTLNVRATRQAIEIMVKQLKHDFSHALDSVRAKLIQLKWKNLLRKPPWTVFAERNKAWRNLPVSIEFAQALFNNFYHKRNGHDLSLNRESFESIINISWAIASSMAESKKVKFTLHYEPDVPEILLDKWILAQVFVNLFLNSIAAIPQDRLGQITVKVRVDVREWAYKSALETEFGTQTVIVEIQDNGKGLSKEQQTTLDKPVPPKSTTGWGLWIVRKNLRLHNSEMVLDSVLNHGTKVTLTFRVP